MNHHGSVDLVVLVADKDANFALSEILANHQRLAIRAIQARVIPGEYHDSYVFRRCHDLLRSQLGLAGHALVIFDREGCGSLHPRDVLEADVEARLAQNGWVGCSAGVVIDPELEAWVWGDSPHVDEALGWPCGGRSLRQWLEDEHYLIPGQRKPSGPKEAVQHAMRLARKKRSSALYGELARKVSFEHCSDPAFLKLKATLRRWFPPQSGAGNDVGRGTT